MPAPARSRAPKGDTPEEIESPEEAHIASYRVVALGASYKLPGKPNSNRYARRGETIKIDDGEAERLTELGAIVPQGEPDPPAPEADKGENPYGGKALVSPEEHAEKVKAASRKK